MKLHKQLDQPQSGLPKLDESRSYERRSMDALTRAIFEQDPFEVALATSIVRAWRAEEVFEMFGAFRRLVFFTAGDKMESEEVRNYKRFRDVFYEVCDVVGFDLFFSAEIIGVRSHPFTLTELHSQMGGIMRSHFEYVLLELCLAADDPIFMEQLVAEWFDQRNSKVPVSALFIRNNFQFMMDWVAQYVNVNLNPLI